MIFTLSDIPLRGPRVIRCETDDFSSMVGEVSKNRKGSWEFHFLANSDCLKPHAVEALRKFGAEQATLLTVKDRLTK